MAVVADAARADRRVLAVGASLSLAGIALSATGSAQIGSWLTVGALLVVLYSLHRLGRAGPDEPISVRQLKRAGKQREG